MADLEFLCGEVGGLTLAVPVERILGIVEPGPLTPIPFSGPGHEGLVAALGRIVPQFGLGRLLGVQQGGDGGVLFIVADDEGAMAARFDHFGLLISARGDEITAPEEAATTLTPRRLLHAGVELPILAVERLSRVAWPETRGPIPPVPAPDARPGAAVTAAAYLPAVNYLIVRVGRAFYAFAAAEIAELTLLPSAPPPVGRAPAWVAGVFEHRGAPVIALSMARLLGGDHEDGPGMTALMVDDEIGRVALMVDGLVGVERVETSMLSDLTQRVGVVRRYFLSVERAVVGIVTPPALLAPVVRALAEQRDALTTGGNATAAARHDFTRTRADYRRILTIRVGAEIVALALERVERILPAVPLTSLPGDGAGFHGLSDIGDVVVPVLDLRIRLEQPVSEEPAVLIVVLLDAAPAGILVSEVLRIEDVPVDAFVSVEHLTSLPVAQTVRMGEQHVPLLLLERLLPNPPTIPGPGRHRSM